MAPTKTNRGRKVKIVPSGTLAKRALTKVQKKQVKAIVKGNTETKRTAWYQSYSDGTGISRATGKFSDAGAAVTTNVIASVNLDVLRLVPAVIQGNDDFNRVGNSIRPTSLVVNGTLRVNIARMGAEAILPTDIRVCIYVLQHKQLKDYMSLYNNIQLNQLLDTEEGTTTKFAGLPINETMRVSDQYFTLCKKKIITLRYAGVTAQGGAVNFGTSVANSHNYYATYSMNLTKNIPKVLKYPETGNAGVAEFQNAPTNSSLFMCMGFVDQTFVSNFTEPVENYLQQTYVSRLSFKDA